MAIKSFVAPASHTRQHQLLLLSAASSGGLETMTGRLADYLTQNGINLADLAHTLQTDYEPLTYRRAVVGYETKETADALKTLDPERVMSMAAPPTNRPVIFMFPGHGTQYVNMGRDLYETEPIFRQELDACADIAARRIDLDIRAVLYTDPSGASLNQLGNTQATILAVEYALARLWMSWGVQPAAMIGHSSGEYTAACLAGVFTLDEVYELLRKRRIMMKDLPRGAMASISLPADRIERLIANRQLSLATVNSPNLCVVAGTVEAMDDLEKELLAQAVHFRRLHIGYGYHSFMMEPIVEPYAAAAAEIKWQRPQIPYISNVTGDWITDDQATNPDYLSKHMRETAHFSEGLAKVLQTFPDAVLLEVGPSNALSSLARQQGPHMADRIILPTLRHPRDERHDTAFILETVGQLWLAGVKLDWTGFYADAPQRLSLPAELFAGREETAPETEGIDAKRTLTTPYTAPRSELEQKLVGIWQEILGRQSIGVHDDFFKLGGNSLMGTQILSRLRQSLQVELPLASLFQSTTVAKMATAVTQLDQDPTSAAAPPLVPVHANGHLPLSFAQQRLWFLAQLNPGDVSYNVTAAIQLNGPLRIDILQQSLNEIWRRHTALRTTFTAVDGQPGQVIADNAPPDLPVVDLRGLSKEERKNRILSAVKAEAGKPFNLAQAPLARLQLLRAAQEEHILILNMHHIISDGWSINLMGEELAVLYGAFSRGEPSPLPELPIQYSDFAYWQRQWLSGETLTQMLDYWREQLADAPALLDLPTDRLRPPADNFRGKHHTFNLPASLVEAFKSLGQSEGATLFMTLLAAFQFLLFRYSGQKDFLIGSPIAGRSHTEIENLVGFFVNTLILRADMNGRPTFRELLARVRKMTLDAYQHQELPFDRLVEELNPDRDASHAPLFQVMFVLQNANRLKLPTYSDVTISLLPQATEATRFDLLVGFVEENGLLYGSIEYNTDLFDTETIERLTTHFHSLLEMLTAQPDRPLAELSFISNEEYQQLLVWGKAAAAKTNIVENSLLLDGAQIYLLDETQQPVPIGIPGEIYIGGPNVSSGYLNKSNLAEEHFVAEPSIIAQENGQKADGEPLMLYRTGDIARFRPNGDLQFLGRKTDRIFYNGRRIWPTQIEAVIQAHTGVKTAVVTTQAPTDEETANKRLVAYVVFETADSAEKREGLRRALAERLPRYMRPSILIPLPTIPQTPEGQPDYQALAKAAQQIADFNQDMFNENAPQQQETERQRTELAERQRKLSDQKRILLERAKRGLLKNKQALGQTAMATIQKRPRLDEYPLSFAQQRMWFLDQLTPGVAVNNIAGCIRLQGSLDVAALERSLGEIVRRHEALRTTFKTENGKPVQVINPPAPVYLPIANLADVSTAEREAKTKEAALEKFGYIFDLAVGPLYAFSLLRLDDQDHILVMNMHHIISDGWSMGVLTRELNVLYQAFSTSQLANLKELPIQYSDFAYWQRQWLEGEELSRQVDYWKRQLDGQPPALELPTDRPRPAVQTFNGVEMFWSLPQETAEGLIKLGRQENATPFMTFLAAFNALLHRYTGQTDLLVGSPIANRTHSEIENLIGFFVNTLVLRSDLSGRPTFREVLNRVRQTTLDANAHQDLPFEKLVTELHLSRDLSHTPLFQVMFIMENLAGQSRLHLPGLTLSAFEVGANVSQFDLTLLVQERPEGWGIRTRHNSDLFDEATIDKLIQRWQTLLAAILTAPDQSVADLPWLTENDQRQLQTWNQTARNYPQTASIQELFEEQAARTPSAVALSFEGQEMTYRELNERANQLAHYLRQQGVGPEVCVGICLERSFDMVIAIYGVLKAGGAYAPIDPTYPTERLAFMLADAQVPILITHSAVLKDQLAELTGDGQPTPQFLCLDQAWPVIEQQPDQNPKHETADENLAYVIYTSGSTGQPKGAMNRHGAIRNRILWMQEAYQLTPEDRVLQKTPLSFDVSVWEFVWPLLFGARLVIARPEGHKDSAYLVDFIAREGVTTLHFVPSMLQLFLEELALSRCTSLKRVICSGEALPFELQERFFERLTTELHNLYGPTEAAIDVTYWACKPDETSRVVPIGRPIANVQMHILDAGLNAVPVGVAGELHIGGAGLGRGYLNRPGLTGEKFIPNPFSDQPGARLYKTGDLARYRPDGSIEYLGRLDFQVKIRGFRIELGEIETILASHPDVRECLVIADDSGGQHKRLVGYIVPNQTPPTTTDLRRFLQERLPEYMVPALYVFLDAMPLNANGKVNRRSLPVPDPSRPELETEFAAPIGEAETTLADIWRQILGLDKVGRYDNFFELGGDSILSIQVVSQANRAGLHLTPAQVFQHQTIADLAQAAGSAPQVLAEQELVSGPVPLMPVQRWFFEQKLTQQRHFNQAFLLTLQEDASPTHIKQAVQHLLTQHDALRLRFFKQEDGAWRQENALPGDTPFLLVDLANRPASQQAALIQKMSAGQQADLNLSEGPLLRVILFKCRPHNDDHLLIIIHHLAVDGVSWRILLEDLETIYRQLVAGAETVQLPPKTTAYKQWAERLLRYAQSPELLADLDYWQAQSPPQSAHLPTDFRREPEANSRKSAGTVWTELTRDETRGLLQDVPPVYNTQINDVLLTSLMQTLSNWTDSRSLTIDLEGHGRESLFDDVDLSRTVGWFTTIFPVRLTLDNRYDPEQGLKQIKEQLRQLPGRGLSYGLLRYLREDEKVRRALAERPTAEIVFNYLGQFDQVTADSSLIAFSALPVGPTQSPENRRSHLLEINATIVGGRLQMNWTFSENLHDWETITRLAEETMDAIRALIRHCQTAETGGFTPSDFPEADLDQEALDALVANL